MISNSCTVNTEVNPLPVSLSFLVTILRALAKGNLTGKTYRVVLSGNLKIISGHLDYTNKGRAISDPASRFSA